MNEDAWRSFPLPKMENMGAHGAVRERQRETQE